VSNEDPTQNDVAAEDLTDEIAKKYDPERLLKLLSKKAGRGDALDPTTRAKYEKRFGVDLGHVRVITGEFAEEFNRKREAFAVTVGSTGMVLMGNSPDKAAHTAAGQALLAHELTHVAQATRGLHRKGQFDSTLAFTEQDEAEAHAVEDQVEQESQGQGASASAAEQTQAKMASEEKKKQQIEKIKARVLELMAEAERNAHARNGSARRP
jgi:Domain of unknown function (DUF4157)